MATELLNGQQLQTSFFKVSVQGILCYTHNLTRNLILDRNHLFIPVIAIDLDPKKIECAQHNAAIYNVANRIEFIVGDYMQLAPSLSADVVFLSPPWGGPNYLQADVFDLKTMIVMDGWVANY